jgi:tetratricopeptide (TPR) repeat protein
MMGWRRWLLVGALAAATLLQARRGLDRLMAGRLLRAAEARTVAATRVPAAQGIALLEGNLSLLRRAGELDPAEIAIVVGRGSQYLLLRRPDAAIGAYRQALALEPRPEIYLNLGRAQRLAGRYEEARASFATAVQLDPNLASQAPQ